VSPIVIPLTAIALPAFLVPTLMVLKQRHQKRHWQHLERMNAIANGLPGPPSGSPPGSGAVIAIGAGVPALAILGALFVSISTRHYMPHALERMAIAWGCALLISMGAMITSLILFVLQHRAHARATAEAAASYGQAPYDSTKPTYDPDAFDVVARRG
jgi:hypothetical protein